MFFTRISTIDISIEVLIRYSIVSACNQGLIISDLAAGNLHEALLLHQPLQA
jgi:hypothetical protein